MDRKVRDQKLDSLARCLVRIEENAPKTVAELESDIDRQDILILNLERLVQVSVDAGIAVLLEKGWSPIPDTMGAVFATLAARKTITSDLAEKLKKSVGFRKVCVHEYDKINWNIVFAIVTSQLGTFREYARIIDAV